jgi:type II secretory pathway component PulF
MFFSVSFTMTAHLNNRLSSIALTVTLTTVICWVCLAFYVPHLEQLWSDDHVVMPAPLTALIHLSHLSHDGRLAAIMFSLFAASLGWRIVVARRLRNSSSRGFDVVRQTDGKQEYP